MPTTVFTMSDHISTLTTDLLVHELNGVTNWQSLGMFLGLDMAEIKEIEQDHLDTPRRRMEMLEKWMRKQGHPSWEMVFEALEKMSELRLANQLRVKYYTQQHQDEKPLTSKSEEQPDSQVTEMEKVLKIDQKDAVVQELESLEVHFFELVTSTENSLKKVGPSATMIKRFAQFYMKAEVDNVDELFDQMKPFFLFDYRLLEKIVEVFLKHEQSVVCELNQYIQRLNDFKSSTTVQQFMQSIETAQKPLTTTDSSTKTTVVIQLVGNWLQKTIMDLDKLLKVLFQDKASVLSHLRISPGSVIITYLTPLTEVDGLIMIAQEQVPFMLQVGVCELMIGHTVVTSTQRNRSSFTFESSLIRAVQDDNINVLHFLLKIDTSPNAADKMGQTALSFGSFCGKSKAVGLLLDANANPNLRTNYGVTPLFMASQEGYADIVSLLLEADANPDLYKKDGATPLLIASQEGHADIVSLLLKANANPNLYKEDGATPLLVASQTGHSDVVSLLLKANANPNLRTNYGATPLYVASQNGHTEIISLLLEANANPNLFRDDGATPLFIASQQGHTDVVDILLKANVNSNLHRDDGTTPLFMATQQGHSDIISLLLKANANPNLHVDDGTTPLMFACCYKHLEVVQLLLAGKADPNLLSYNGISALMFACRIGYLKSVQLLRMYGADLSLQTPGGLTALDMAAFNGHRNIVDLIHAV